MELRLLTFRELVNPAILNDEDMVGFFGDSEYENVDGKLIMGYWTFVDVLKDEPVRDTDWNLDSVIEEETLWDGIQNYLVRNDNGTLCEIKLHLQGGLKWQREKLTSN